MDIRAHIDQPINLKTMERKLIPTGIFIEMPKGMEAQIRPRSGLAIKHGLTLLNSPGTIDADYRGEICIIMINLSNQTFSINNSDRIAQIVFSQPTQIQWREVSQINTTSRGSGGFGSTGKD